MINADVFARSSRVAIALMLSTMTYRGPLFTLLNGSFRFLSFHCGIWDWVAFTFISTFTLVCIDWWIIVYSQNYITTYFCNININQHMKYILDAIFLQWWETTVLFPLFVHKIDRPIHSLSCLKAAFKDLTNLLGPFIWHFLQLTVRYKTLTLTV